ncbi:hypothetical protein A3770_13p70140 [Chloropicon primus]|uniref:Uncharacterized protein n=1 Tax=Chloropicon primus TaxID=1764295 RepID=A0A5B8MWE1_9CHLO|nr:hypothetical protein A3770_13p70140 [Chloropicon primus]|eukprot:QDZ24496.1 hypothetical protein A3770_13p70140 [Chloropicon primus]
MRHEMEGRKVRAVTKLLYETRDRSGGGGEGFELESRRRTSELLTRVQNFLPKIAKANEEMEVKEDAAREGDGEEGEGQGQEEGEQEEEEAYVEMDVAIAPSELASRIEEAVCTAAANAAGGEEPRGEVEEEEASGAEEEGEGHHLGPGREGLGEEAKGTKRRKLIEEL